MESEQGLLEILAVGRKTPGDGKLEVSTATADRLEALGSENLPVIVAAPMEPAVRRGQAAVTSMRCTCAKTQQGGEHEHRFVESPLFRDLIPGSRVSLALTGSGELSLRLLP